MRRRGSSVHGSRNAVIRNGTSLLRGARYYKDLIHQLEKDGETDTGYKRVGAISIHTDASKLDKMEERAYKRREDAPEIGDITRLSVSETKKLFPILADGYESIHISGAARVNGRALCRSLLSAAEKRGATVIKGNASLLLKTEQSPACKQIQSSLRLTRSL